MEEPSIPQGLADKIHEPLSLDEGSNDTMDTTVPLEDEDTLATTVLPSSPCQPSNEQANSKRKYLSVSADDAKVRRVFKHALGRKDPLAEEVQSILDYMTANNMEEIQNGPASMSTVDVCSLIDGQYLTDAVLSYFIQHIVNMRPDDVYCLAPAAIDVIKISEGTLECFVKAEAEILFLPLCSGLHWVLMVAVKATAKLEIYDSLMQDRRSEDAELGLKFAGYLEQLGKHESDINDWFRGLSWSVTLQDSQQQEDWHNCGLYLLNNMMLRLDLAEAKAITDPLKVRVEMIRFIADVVGVPVHQPPP